MNYSVQNSTLIGAPSRPIRKPCSIRYQRHTQALQATHSQTSSQLFVLQLGFDKARMTD